MSKYKYNRVLLKLSGEAFVGSKDYGIDHEVLQSISEQLHQVAEDNIELGVVIGGGNIFRGLPASETRGTDRATADYMGMLATVMNAMALQESLEKLGSQTRVLSALRITELCEPYLRRRAIRHLEKKRIVIFAAGTGNPFFTTDTAASLRAMEIGADIILKATKVDGVFDKDPVEYSDAKLYKKISYLECLNQELKVMDSTAISLCMDNDMPIFVFNLTKTGNIQRALMGEGTGTMVAANHKKS